MKFCSFKKKKHSQVDSSRDLFIPLEVTSPLKGSLNHPKKDTKRCLAKGVAYLELNQLDDRLLNSRTQKCCIGGFVDHWYMTLLGYGTTVGFLSALHTSRDALPGLGSSG